jgi:DNA-binding IclR family transcriptional regulator
MATTETERQNIRVISRAASILKALGEHPQGLTLGEIAQLVDLPRSTVQRIVDALDHEHFVVAASIVGGVRLGPALLSLANSIKLDIVDFARPVLTRLAQDTGETVDLSVLNRDQLVFVDQVPGIHRLRAVSAVGMSFPLHCTAPGKALLAALPEAEFAKLRGRLKLNRLTGNTLTSWEQLDIELASARKHGMAFDREEHSVGICAVGAAVHSPGGELAAVSIPVPTQRFASSTKSLVKMLRKSCQALDRHVPR